MSWTDDRIEVLEHYWRDGYSASQIAQRLGDVTRNAVIGKVHRLGLPGRSRQSNRVKPARSRSAPQLRGAPSRRRSNGGAFRIRRSPAPPMHGRQPLLPDLGPAPPIPVTVQSLTALTCRWPEGDPKGSGFHFCGRIKERAGSPYCDHHDAVAHR
jgi:GcrA cell cycle regulator